MQEVKRYRADDGKEFKSEDECRKHETAVSVCRQVARYTKDRAHMYDYVIDILNSGLIIAHPSRLIPEDKT